MLYRKLLVLLLGVACGLCVSHVEYITESGHVASGLLATDVLKSRAPEKALNPHRWIMIIGGPGMGKTSVINELAARGYAVVQEAATSVIKEHQQKGCAEPWLLPDFQTQISLLHAERELNAERQKHRIVFFDRGPVDSLSYMLFYQSKYQQRLVELIEGVLARKMYEPTIFFLEALSLHEKNVVRHEEAEEAQKLADKFVQDYVALGFKVIKVPCASIKDRADFILAQIGEPVAQQPTVQLDITVPQRALAEDFLALPKPALSSDSMVPDFCIQA